MIAICIPKIEYNKSSNRVGGVDPVRWTQQFTKMLTAMHAEGIVTAIAGATATIDCNLFVP